MSAAFAGVPAPTGAAPQANAAAAPALSSVATDRIKDLTCTLRVTQVDFEKLGKIDKGITTQFRTLKRADVAYKSPNKVRLSNSIAQLVYNGDTRRVRIKLVGLNKTDNVAGQPGQKQSLLSLGVFATDYLNTDYEAHFVRREGALLVYNLTQRNTDNRSHEVVTVDPKTHLIVKRVSFNGDEVKRMETRYLDARQIRPGVWLPGRIEVYNQFGELGGTQSLEDAKVNLGVDDSLFATS
jgi:outer membrane lipoprotein-sorting protein